MVAGPLSLELEDVEDRTDVVGQHGETSRLDVGGSHEQVGAELLRLDGHETEAVYSAQAAIQRAVSFSPDVVLLDIGLPEMDGYQVAQHIRQAAHGIRIIALTGYGRTEDMLRARAVGFDAHMVKPVDFDALERVIAAPPEYPRVP